MLKNYSQNDLNDAFLRMGKDAFFIQIGAMDGVTFDPIYPFVKELQWRGILIEPLLDMFEKLRQNYAGCENLVFVNKAIADFDGEVEIVRIDPEAVERKLVGTGALGISTIMPERGPLGNVESLKPQTREALEKYRRVSRVPCCTLPTLLADNQVKRIGLLAIDTEGMDWIIAQQLPLDKFRPRLIYMEYNHLPEDEKEACVAHFTKAGYRIRLDANNQENLLAEFAG